MFDRVHLGVHLYYFVHIPYLLHHKIRYSQLDCDSTAMDNFAGKWKFESGQGFDEFLKDRGIGKLSKYVYIIKC